MWREKDVLISYEKVLAILNKKYFVNITADSDLKKTVKLVLIPQEILIVYWNDLIVIKVFRKFIKPLRHVIISPFVRYIANSKFSRRKIFSMRFSKWGTYYSLWEKRTGTTLNVSYFEKIMSHWEYI